jgi:hypothetical protein
MKALSVAASSKTRFVEPTVRTQQQCIPYHGGPRLAAAALVLLPSVPHALDYRSGAAASPGHRTPAADDDGSSADNSRAVHAPDDALHTIRAEGTTAGTGRP